MNIVLNLVVALQIVAALVMIGLVLVQHGKGADMGASFGSGASGSLFGATGSANFLSRSTAVCATIFFIATLALAALSNERLGRAASGTGSSVLDRPSIAASAPAGPAAPRLHPRSRPPARRRSRRSNGGTSPAYKEALRRGHGHPSARVASFRQPGATGGTRNRIRICGSVAAILMLPGMYERHAPTW